MEKLSLAIVSRNEDYNKALSMSLVSVYRDFNIKCFDSEEFIREWVGYTGKGLFHETFDMVLWAGEEISDSFVDNIVYLCDKLDLIQKDYSNNRFCIYKYSTANAIVASIFDIYTHLTGENSRSVRKNNVRTFACASCFGGSGCTTLALAISQELCRFHEKRVLYLSMEDVESVGDIFEIAPETRNLGEYLYKLLSHREKLDQDDEDSIPIIDGYIAKTDYGVEFFAPCKGKNPLRELSTDDIQNFIAALCDCGRYDCIVIDLSGCMTEAGIATMLLVERVCLISKRDQYHSREDNYLSQLICSAGEEIVNKFVRVNNMALLAQNKSEEKNPENNLVFKEEILPCEINIRKNAGMNTERMVMLEDGFGQDIAKLAKILLES